jgi:hypothetical protein
MARIDQTSLPISDLLIRRVPCNATVAVGDWVYLDNAGTAIKAIATGSDESNVFGLVESKDSTILANIRTFGQSTELFTLLDPSKEYFLSASTAGTMTLTPPSGSAVYVVNLGRPVTDKRFLIRRTIRLQRA